VTYGPHSHEAPILLVLGRGDGPAEAFRALLAHPDVAAFALPAVWALEAAGADLTEAIPGVRHASPENLDEVLDALVRILDAGALDRLVQRTWREVDERVRAFYLERGALEVMASALRVARPSRDLPPPESFRDDRVHEHAFAMEYRLRRLSGPRDPGAPAEEGSLVFYPFDPADLEGRREAGLEEGPEATLEVFAYAAGRARHRAVLEDVAARRGWRVVDPLA
jgi:hypothetical protein